MDHIEKAQEAVLLYLDDVIEQLKENGKASTDIFNNYPGAAEHHHTYHNGEIYTLLEAAQILDEFHEFKETDRGLWEGLEPEKAIIAQANYTYSNVVMFHWRKLIEVINKDDDVAAFLEVIEEFNNCEKIPEEGDENYDDWMSAVHNYDYGETLEEAENLLREEVKTIIDKYQEWQAYAS